MTRRLAGILLAAFLFSSVSCGPGVDLATALKVTDTFSGYYDFGIVNGLNKLVPSISFRLQSSATVPITQVQLIVGFWQKGADGDLDSREVTGIGSTALTPGGNTDPILVRSAAGYTIAQPRSELFTNSEFKDFTAKVFAKRAGKIVPLGEFPIEHRIIPHIDEPVRP
ncbi:MAG: hypothetical protein ABI634_07905 [Acidobacteriota bacterium]